MYGKSQMTVTRNLCNLVGKVAVMFRYGPEEKRYV